MTHHLGSEKHDPAGANSGNSRNGKSAKMIKGKRGQLHIDVPRDRTSSFEPQLIKKGQTRFDCFDERDHFDVCAGYDVSRDSSPLARDLWR
jgi:putative transposase